MRIWKRTWFWVLAATVLCLGAVASLFLTDEPPHPDQDLRGIRRAVAEAENGFHLVDLGGNAVAWPEEEEEASFFATSEKFDRQAARELVEQNEELLRRVPECLALPEFQVPEISSLDDPMRYLMAWSDLAHLVQIRARLLADEGRVKEALEDGLLLVRFGHRIEGAQGVAHTAFFGQGIRVRGALSIIEASRHGNLPLVELPDLLAALGRHERNLEGFKDSLRGDYRVLASLVDAVAAGSTTRLPIGIECNLPQFLVRLLLKANQTKRLLAEETRLVLAGVGRPPSRGGDLGKSSPAISFLRAVVNHPGKDLVQEHCSGLERILAFEVHQVFDLRAAQVFIALKAFEAATGKLPDSLAALVPEYLPAVPVDPFDGQPLRFDAARRIVYSVGSDLTDAQGSGEEAPLDAMNDLTEPTLHL